LSDGTQEAAFRGKAMSKLRPFVFLAQEMGKELERSQVLLQRM